MVKCAQANVLLSIPVVAAIILFVYLHRRHVKRQRREDANDPHASLDFGMDPASATMANKKGQKGIKGAPEMAVTDIGMEKSLRRGRGLSMDMDVGSPYLLPPGLHGSRESLHSMSRTVPSGDDKYRPATTLTSNDSSSLHSYPTQRNGDDSSSYAGSASTGRGYGHDGMNQNLLRNAQRMSRSMPPTQRSPAPVNKSNPPQIQAPDASMQLPRKGLPPTTQNGGLAPAAREDARDSYQSKDGAAFRQSNNYLGSFIHSREASVDHIDKTPSQSQRELPTSPPPALLQAGNRNSPPLTINAADPTPRPPRKQSLNASAQPAYQQNSMDDESNCGGGFKVTPPSPPQPSRDLQPDAHHQEPISEDRGLGIDSSGLGFDVRRLSMGFRPLPPDDPTDNPEQRANRIRSFYKEYFDESKAGPAPVVSGYAEDYDQAYLGDGAVLDSASGQYVVGQPQYAEPYTRRAMTPPPRAPPRFQGASRHQPTFSGGSGMPPGPRAFSSASHGFGPSGRGPPKKALPPPVALNILPSPHLLREDSMLPIDFAPPTNYKERQAGHPESPRGGFRPYSPMLPAHTPLTSSFDDLSVMPSP